jgi:acyl-CoA dehydrogenase
MNFELDETQDALASLAAQVLGQCGGHDRAREVELDSGFDVKAWETLGATGLLSAIADGDGGVVGACLVATALGRDVVTVPGHALLTPLVVSNAVVDAQRRSRLTAGQELLTLALHEVGIPDAAASACLVVGDTLTGSKPMVSAARESGAVLVAATGADGPGLYLVETAAPGVHIHQVRATDRGSAATLIFEAAPAQQVGDAQLLQRVEQVATLLTCATVLGLARAAIGGAAGYITERKQFGRPIASFQAPVHRLADAYIDLEAMTVTLQQAAWQLDAGRSPAGAAAAVATAKWWSATGGHRALHTAQHLHGGLGADIEYPAHRYFLRGKQLLDTYGGSAVQALRLGAAVAASVRREGARA